MRTDYISRNGMLTAIQKAYVDTNGGEDRQNARINVGLTKALNIVQDAPSIQLDELWIPADKQLPEIDVPVLIYQQFYEGENVTIGRYHADGGSKYWQWIKYDGQFKYGIDHFGIICPGDKYHFVKAWMPLPGYKKSEG